MFPLAFPMAQLARLSREDMAVLDPFSGRGTTILAARLHGLPAYGLDSSPVAVAASSAKLVNTSAEAIVNCATDILEDGAEPKDIPVGEFWDLAFHPDVLRDICRLREALMEDNSTPERIALRALIMGALHGPRKKNGSSYLSNQAPRTFAPKPAYAVGYWKREGLAPIKVKTLDIVQQRAHWYYGSELPRGMGTVHQADSRESQSYLRFPANIGVTVTSPPYYGLRTYIPDQWLRAWFVGGNSRVQYRDPMGIEHSSPQAFAADLRRVWHHVARVSREDAILVVRFGAIGSREVDPVGLLEESVSGTPWKVRQRRHAGDADRGKRQATVFGRRGQGPRPELDVLFTLN